METDPTARAELLAGLANTAKHTPHTGPVLPRLAYSLEEIAKMCGVSKRVIETLANSGRLRTKRIGRRLCVTQRDLERWING